MVLRLTAGDALARDVEADGLAGDLVVLFVEEVVVGVDRLELFEDLLVLAFAGAWDAPSELEAVPSFPAAALLAFDVATALWAAFMSDWYWPSPPLDELPLPVFDEFPFRANTQSAKNTTVPTRRAINERDADIATGIIGTSFKLHER